jgi:hypothetical protein
MIRPLAAASRFHRQLRAIIARNAVKLAQTA